MSTRLLQLIRDAKNESERILRQAQEGAEMIRKQAYEEAYEHGCSKATKRLKKGYQNGYDVAIQKAKEEANKIIENAVQTLNSAKVEYEAYLQDKKAEIIKLSINIAEHILNREVAKWME